jgi:hypothetical protein
MRPLALVILLAFAACTIVPKPIAAPRVASIGENGQRNSGLLKRLPNGAGYVIDAQLLSRYNGLIARFGAEPNFQPALKPDQGVTILPAGDIVLSVHAMSDLALMNAWRREGRLPTPKPGFIQRLLE